MSEHRGTTASAESHYRNARVVGRMRVVGVGMMGCGFIVATASGVSGPGQAIIYMALPWILLVHIRPFWFVATPFWVLAFGYLLSGWVDSTVAAGFRLAGVVMLGMLVIWIMFRRDSTSSGGAGHLL